jgi:hypothetical protein
VHHEPGGVKPAQPLRHAAVQQPIVLGGGLPAHPAEQAERAHQLTLAVSMIILLVVMVSTR